MEINLIFAQGLDGAFGLNNTIPWRAPSDLAFFAEKTKGHAVIMGKNTWHSLPPAHRPLKERLNIIVSQELADAAARSPLYDPSPKDPNVQFVRSLEIALGEARIQGHSKAFIIGGPSLLMEARLKCTYIYQTVVDYEGPADVKAPAVINSKQWRLVSAVPSTDMFVRAPKDQVGVRFLTWQRIA